MELKPEKIENMDNIKIRKMLFLHNALNSGWTIKKRNDSYIFTKNHEGKKEVFLESYLQTFIMNNMTLGKLG
jgi:hypothetical protein